MLAVILLVSVFELLAVVVIDDLSGNLTIDQDSYSGTSVAGTHFGWKDGSVQYNNER